MNINKFEGFNQLKTVYVFTGLLHYKNWYNYVSIILNNEYINKNSIAIGNGLINSINDLNDPLLTMVQIIPFNQLPNYEKILTLYFEMCKKCKVCIKKDIYEKAMKKINVMSINSKKIVKPIVENGYKQLQGFRTS